MQTRTFLTTGDVLAFGNPTSTNGTAVRPAMWIYTRQHYYTKSLVSVVQEKLNSENYNCGTADGKLGQKTMSAIKQYQKDHNMTPSGVITDELREILQL